MSVPGSAPMFEIDQSIPRGPTSTTAGPSAVFERNLAVCIGINTYGVGISPLRSAVADAAAVGDVLRRDHGFEVWSLFEDDARLDHLHTLLHDRLPAALGPNDRLLFYFAGHGIALDRDTGPAGYLIPARANRANQDEFLSMFDVHRELAQLPVRHALVILDCCFAGTFRWSSLRDVDLPSSKIYRERYAQYIESAAWQVLTSASSEQLALDVLANDRGDATGPHSPFALALLEGLAGAADYTDDGLITADELGIFVRERVAPAAGVAGHRQIPQLFPLDRHRGGQFVFQVPNRPLDLEPAPTLSEELNPYRGLHSYREEDRSLFFGRDDVAQRLVAAVTAQPLTVVVGPSGSGKSSLVQAGLVPRLRARGWVVLPSQRPGREPVAILERWVRHRAQEVGPRALADAWLAMVRAISADQPWFVIIDQLEELLTHYTIESDRSALFAALAEALATSPHLHLVITLRSDTEPQLHDTALGRWWAAARFGMPAMSRDELRQAIERPATATVLHFSPAELVERLIDDVALVPAPLPLLSFALSELYRQCWSRWQRGERDRALREADYEAMGCVSRALTQRATELHDEFVAEHAGYAITIRNVFVRMVATANGEFARRRVPRDELTYDAPGENQRIAEVLQRFHEARLISLGNEPSGDGGVVAYAEPTHDELVRGWPHVTRWLAELDTPPGTRALLGAVAGAVQSWWAHALASSYLWYDPRVELASVLQRDHQLLFNAREAQFIERSARLRQQRRARLTFGVIVTIAVLATVAVFALWQRGIALDKTAEAQANAAEAQTQTAEAQANAAEAQAQKAEAQTNAAEAQAQKAKAQTNAAEAQAQKAEAQKQTGRATAAAAESRRRLARTYQETGRQLLLGGRPLEALPYLTEARAAGAGGLPLRILFSAAARDLPMLQFEHPDDVRSVAFSDDGALAVTTSDNIVRIWSTASGQPIGAPFVHPKHVLSAVLDRASVRLITAGGDGTARIWNVATGKLVCAPLQHQGVVTQAVLSPDEQHVLTASYDHTARVWNASTCAPETPPLPHADVVWSAAFSPDSKRVVTASWDGTAQIWDAATGEQVAGPLLHRNRIWSVAFSPNGTQVATASQDSTARIWDAASGRALTRPIGHDGVVFKVVFSADGRHIATASWGGTAQIWSASTGALVATVHHAKPVDDVAFSPDGTRIVTASEDGTARIWNAATGEPLSPPLQHSGAVARAAFSPGTSGSRILTASTSTAQIWVSTSLRTPVKLQHNDPVLNAVIYAHDRRIATSSGSTVQIWDTRRRETVGQQITHAETISRLVLSADESKLATASDDGTARIWDAGTGSPLTPPLRHGARVVDITISRDGERAATASEDGTARIWDIATGKLVRSLRHAGPVVGVAFDSTGTRLATASQDGEAREGGAARIWNAQTGQPLLRIPHSESFGFVRFSPDDTRLITVTTTAARVWEVASGQPMTPPMHHQSTIMWMAVNRDGTRLVTASHDNTARIWNLVTGRPSTPPLEHHADVWHAEFSPDGTVVATTSGNMAYLWDASTGGQLAAPLPHAHVPFDVKFSADGTRIVTACADKSAYVWDLEVDPGTLAEWRDKVSRAPYRLIDGVLAPRDSPATRVPPSATGASKSTPATTRSASPRGT